MIGATRNSSDQMNELASLQSKNASRRLKDMLRSMLTQTGVSGKLLPSHIASDAWIKLTEEIISICVNLRLQMTVSERFYELYSVSIGTRTSSSEMVDASGDFVPEDQSVSVCLAPAVIEYSAEQLGRNPSDLLIDSGERIFIKTNLEDRVKGTTISPAIVSLSN